MNYGDQYGVCPNCGGATECESVDVGVGLYLYGEYACDTCGWDESHPPPTLAMEERPFAIGDADAECA